MGTANSARGSYIQREPLVAINYLTVSSKRPQCDEPWICLFPKEIQALELSRAQLTTWGAITAAVGDITWQGHVLFRTSDITCYVYQHKLSILAQLAELGVIAKASPGLWVVNPRYAWAGVMTARRKAVFAFENNPQRKSLSEDQEEP